MWPTAGGPGQAPERAREAAPAGPRLIGRGDLLAALDRATARKVTIISAPAGSGKTSLLRTWAGQPGQPHRLAVVPVQRDQHDAQQFWLALLSAVRNASAATARAEPPAATPDFNGRAMVDRVLAELAGQHGRLIVIIDDLHELDSPDALGQLTTLLTNLPDNVHAVLATRRDLRLRLHQLRLAGGLAEIRAADLRFTARETRQLLDASGIALSEAGVALLHQRTEGWAAGLRLAAISLADHPDPERFVAEFSGSDRTVAEYLLAEMLERQPADVQSLLLRTSLLDCVNGELADLLTGHRAQNGSCWSSKTRTRLSYRSTPRAPGSATTTCSRICSVWSCAGRGPKKCPSCTGGPPPGSPSMAGSPTPSGTCRRRAIGPARPGCWLTVRSA